MSNLDAMAVAGAAVLLIGVAAAKQHDMRPILLVAGVLVIGMALSRGFYWNLFGRGEGFFTANRVTAFIVFVALLLGPAHYAKVDQRDHQ